MALLAVARPAHADTVKLKSGGTLENVKAKIEGDMVRVIVDHGSIVVSKDDVLSITTSPTKADELNALRDQLAQRKLAAGEDSSKIRGVAVWARANGMTDEADQLGALARGIDLDLKIESLQGSKTVAPYVTLARTLGPEYTAEERASVLRAGLRIDPDNASIHAALGEVKRDNAWVTRLEAARLDREALAREMAARGLIQYDGRWMTPEAARLADERKALERDREAADQARLNAQLAAADQERAAADAERRQLQAERDQLDADRQAAAQAAANDAANNPYPYSGDTYGYGAYGYGTYGNYGYPYTTVVRVRGDERYNNDHYNRGFYGNNPALSRSGYTPGYPSTRTNQPVVSVVAPQRYLESRTPQPSSQPRPVVSAGGFSSGMYQGRQVSPPTQTYTAPQPQQAPSTSRNGR